jgi:uncharacterized protein YjbI with pentapeptide repeats
VLSLITLLTASRLRNRWKHQEARVSTICLDLLKEQSHEAKDWTQHLLASHTAGWSDLRGLNTCPRAYHHRGQKAPRDLRGILLKDLDLSDCGALADTCLDYATFDGVVLHGASLRGASLQRATFRSNCVLDSAAIQYANLRRANLRAVSLENADLTGSDIRGADFQEAILVGMRLTQVKYNEEPTFGFVRPPSWRNWTRFGGDYQSVGQIDPRSDRSALRHISGENFRWAFDQSHPAFGRLWYWLANYGRSPSRLVFWILTIWLAFAYLYADLPRPVSAVTAWLEPLANWLSPHIPWSEGPLTRADLSPFYASAATMTSLGFTDVISGPLPLKAQIYVSTQSALALVLLGALITVLLQNITTPNESLQPQVQRLQSGDSSQATPLLATEQLHALNPRYKASRSFSLNAQTVGLLTWQHLWQDMQTNLQHLPRCSDHAEYPRVYTLGLRTVNDLIQVNSRGVTVRSHRTGRDRFISACVLESWWNRLTADGVVLLRTPPTTRNAAVIAAILTNGLPDRVQAVSNAELWLRR